MSERGEVSSSDYLEGNCLDEQPFVIIDNQNEGELIELLCDAVFEHLLSDDDYSIDELEEEEPEEEESGETIDGISDKITFVTGKEFLANFLKNLPKPLTVIQEPYHIDRSFRDTYYMYFSNQHFHVKRYSRRLSFFLGKFDEDLFYSNDCAVQEEMQKNYIGSCVINPLSVGTIGKTLIAPKYVFDDETKPVFVRLSKFSQHILGRTFEVKAFPYRTQDQETMCCAEVTLLNLLEYYANSYDDYRIVVPSEIIEKEQIHSHERVLPTRGVTYPVLTKVLSEFGFSPRLYNISAIDSYKYSSVTRDVELKRWLHYYIESGIPVAINLVPFGTMGTAHSVICIGHGQLKEELNSSAIKKKWLPWSKRDKGHALINSADFYDEYVIIDDNQPLYQVRKFNSLSLYPNMRIDNLAVPLYKRMFMDAPNAYVTIRSILQNESFGIDAWANDFLQPGEDVIIRIFMASSRSYKRFRRETIADLEMQELYTMVPMPRFVWICELYRVCDYNKKENGRNSFRAFGEIIIDATSAPNRGHNSLIMVHYPKMVGQRHPDWPNSGFKNIVVFDQDELIPGYRGNLEEIL